jgi:carbonic anhydrase/acetyltransferase-like protein (isoleucine patch superfamily)
MLHGCTVNDNSLIGMGATVMNGAVIGRNCIVGAHALVGEGKTIEDNSLVLGAPARFARTVDEGGVEMLRTAAAIYVDKMHRYARRGGLKLIESD